MTRVEIGLLMLAALVVGADIALWAMEGRTGAAAWPFYGIAALSLAVALAGVVFQCFRGRRAQIAALSRIRYGLWWSRVHDAAERHASQGLYDSRHFLARLREEIRLSTAYGSSIGLLVVRVDESEGMDPGLRDVVRGRIVSVLRRRLRSSDVAGETGPAEFAVYLPDSDRSQTLITGARLIGLLEGVTPGTVGVAVFPEDGRSVDGLVKEARQRAVPYDGELAESA